MENRYFLWPESSFSRAVSAALSFRSVKQLEDRLQTMFPSGYPVVCTSGRSALFMALSGSEISRNDLVGVFPFASHCVLDAVSRIGTPLGGPGWANVPMRIVYHQWGYLQETQLAANVIEDAVDTLCIPGTQLFPGGGAFEIWSLPKILGTSSGAVLWCRDENMANRIRTKREQAPGGFFQWCLRLLMKRLPSLYDYWEGAECRYRKISRWQTGELWNSIKRWDEIVADRKVKLDIAWPASVKWLEKTTGRLPSNVPAEITNADLSGLGITAGIRTIERLHTDGSRELVKVIPVPIHQDVRVTDLTKMIQALV